MLRVEQGPQRDRGAAARARALRQHAARPRRNRAHRQQARAASPLANASRPRNLASWSPRFFPSSRRSSRCEIRSKRLPATGRAERPSRPHGVQPTRAHALGAAHAGVRRSAARAHRRRQARAPGGAVPIRDEAAERALIHRLRDELNLVFGRRVDFDGREAVRFLARLRSVERRARRRRHELFPQAAAGAAAGDRRRLVRPHLRSRGGETRATANRLRQGRRRRGAARMAGRARAGRRSRAAAGLPCPTTGSKSTAIAWPICWPRATPTARWPTVALPALGELCDELGAPRPLVSHKLAPLLDGFESDPEAPLPPDLTATLRTYQQQGVDWLCFLRDAGLGAVLADDMGLGKTLQALCAVRGAHAGGLPQERGAQLGRRNSPLPPGSRGAASTTARTARSTTSADITLTTYAVLRLDTEICSPTRSGTRWCSTKRRPSRTPTAKWRAPATSSARRVPRGALAARRSRTGSKSCGACSTSPTPACSAARSDFQERYATPIAGGQPATPPRDCAPGSAPSCCAA